MTQFLDDCGTSGRATYRNMQVADIFYPAIVGVFLASSLGLAIRRLSPRPGRAAWLAALPLAAGAFDYLENVFAWLAVVSYPDTIATTHLLGLASAAKTATSWTAGLLLVATVAAILVQASKDRLSAADTEAPDASERDIERDVIGAS